MSICFQATDVKTRLLLLQNTLQNILFCTKNAPKTTKGLKFMPNFMDFQII